VPGFSVGVFGDGCGGVGAGWGTGAGEGVRTGWFG